MAECFQLILCSLCSGEMSESKATCVEIRDVDGQTLRKLVDYIYTAEIEVTEDNVQVCWNTAYHKIIRVSINMVMCL